jgi:hypothetical protein
VRTPRTAGKKKDEILSFHYAFVEFSTEAECEKAKNKLATSRFQAGLEKTRVLKKNQPSGFFGFFYIFAQKREFIGFFQFQEYF